MDSSRSGFLSTLLMTLPLIVVPAIALLRPTGTGSGVAITPLAADEASVDSMMSAFGDSEEHRRSRGANDNAGGRHSETEDFNELFEEDTEVHSQRSFSQKGNAGKVKGSIEKHDPFNPFDEPLNEPDTLTSAVPEPEDAVLPAANSAEKLIEQMNIQGALRTMWFEAGAKSPVGLAVFFRGQTELVRIRFEAVGQTREECARNVFDQVSRWKAEQVNAAQTE